MVYRHSRVYVSCGKLHRWQTGMAVDGRLLETKCIPEVTNDTVDSCTLHVFDITERHFTCIRYRQQSKASESESFYRFTLEQRPHVQHCNKSLDSCNLDIRNYIHCRLIVATFAVGWRNNFSSIFRPSDNATEIKTLSANISREMCSSNENRSTS